MTSPEPSARRADCARLHLLRRYQFDELDAGERGQLDVHLATCRFCAERLARIRQEREAFLERVSVASESVQILERLERGGEGGRSFGEILSRLGGPRLLGAAATLCLIVVLLPTVFGPGEREQGLRTKGGGPSLEMFVKNDQGIIPGQEGMELSPGDQIQFRYQAGGRQHLMVVSVDGRLSISALYPPEEGSSIRIEPSGLRTLEGSIILDDALGPEKVYAFFSSEPLGFEAVRAAIEAEIERSKGEVASMGTVEVPGLEVDQVSIFFNKR